MANGRCRWGDASALAAHVQRQRELVPDARLVNRGIRTTTERSLTRAAHEHLDHAWVAAQPVDLRDSLRRVLLGYDDRALVALERLYPFLERPVVDAGGNCRREVRVRLHSETQQSARQDPRVDTAPREILLHDPRRRGRRLGPLRPASARPQWDI